QRAQWQVARAGIITAGQRPNPSLKLLSQHHSLTEASVLPWTFGLAFDIPIETAGKRGDRIAQAQSLATAAHFQVGEAAWLLRSQVRQRFLDYFAALEQTKLLEAETATRAQMLALMQQRLVAGESAAFDVSTALLDLQRAHLAQARAQAQEAGTRAALAQALGLPVRALNGVEFSFADVEQPPTLQQLPSAAVQRAALLNRLDLRQALARYAAAEAALKLQVAKQYPDLRLGPGYGWEQGDNRWGLSISLTLPLLNQNQGPIAEARARVAETAAIFMALQAQVIGQIDQALANYRGALQTLDAAQAVLARQSAQQHLVEQQ
ncbi:TolC family protein, partial [Acidithiobacillus sp. MC6.1]|nr:TolC family protein [Acidithiobacillus sp. MC6.1]